MIDRYPLTWPIGYKRTERRISSAFKQTMERAQRFLHEEIMRLGATDLVVSSNIPVRKDGLFYTDWMNRRIDDPGVAIYFKYKGKDVAMCCDQYVRIWENVYALGKSIEAMRALERYGVSEFLERAFTGFGELPPPSVKIEPTIWEILGLDGKPGTMEEVVAAYRSKAKIIHPDMPTGDAEKFKQLHNAYEWALTQF